MEVTKIELDSLVSIWDDLIEITKRVAEWLAEIAHIVKQVQKQKNVKEKFFSKALVVQCTGGFKI